MNEHTARELVQAVRQLTVANGRLETQLGELAQQLHELTESTRFQSGLLFRLLPYRVRRALLRKATGEEPK